MSGGPYAIFGRPEGSPTEIAAGDPLLGPVATAARVAFPPVARAADPSVLPALPAPHCALGSVSTGPRWTVAAPADAGAPFLIAGDGIAIAIGVEHAVQLHQRLGAALIAEAVQRAQRAGA